MTEGLSSVVNMPMWSKHICLWIGSEASLERILLGHRCKKMDVLDLLPSEDNSSVLDDLERSDKLYCQLDEYLASLSKSLTGRCILTVRNTALLSRYRAGLKAFYDWFGGRQRMTILTILGEVDVRLPVHLENDVKLDCKAIVEYLVSCLIDPRLVFREK